MKKLTYTITINQPAHVVFDKMTDNTAFPLWAKAWGEDMKCVGDWKEGENLYFTDVSGSGTKAVVEEVKENESVRMKHIAMVEDVDKEVTELDATMEKWIGSNEEYYFKAISENETELTVVIEADEAFEPMMQAWDKALVYLKDVCEN